MKETLLSFLNYKTIVLDVSYCDLHVAKLADGTETASLLPEVADDLTAHSCLTVSEWAAVSLDDT